MSGRVDIFMEELDTVCAAAAMSYTMDSECKNLPNICIKYSGSMKYMYFTP